MRNIVFACACAYAAATFAVEYQYGAVRFDCAVTIDGVAVPANTAVYAESWPTQMCVRPVLGAGETFFRFESDAVAGVQNCPTHFYTQMDGSFYVVPPAFPDTVRDFRGILASRVIWVDAEHGSDTPGGGTEGNPWRTLQYASDQIANSNPTIIFAKDGTYDEGGSKVYEASNRVAFAESRTVLLKSVNGSSKATIVGAADEETYPELQVYYPKMGPKAMRGVCFNKTSGGCAVQGFTIRDCHPAQKYGTDDKPLNPWGYNDTQGGAVFSVVSTDQTLDCVIEDCTSGKALVKTHMRRTLVKNCYSANSIHETAWAISCAFVDCYGDGRMGSYQAYPGYAHQNMAAGQFLHAATLPYMSMSGGRYWNSAFGTQFIPAASNFLWGAIFVNGGQGDSGGGEAYIKTTEQFFADPANNDARIIKGSLAETGVKLPTAGTAVWNQWATNYAALATSDLNGNRTLFSAAGVPMAGAYQKPVQAFVFSPTSAKFDVTSFSGGACGEAGETITIEPNADGTRYAAGVVVNNVTNYFTDLPGGSYSYTVPDEFAAGAVNVTVLIAPYWYVDAVNGNDSNKGITPETAVRTLWKGMSLCAAKETVRALPGTYAEGVTARGNGDTNTLPLCRAYLKVGTTLESTEGPEKTIILGAAAPGADADQDGCGTNAISCVRVASASTAANAVKLKGFTLTGGHTRSGYDGSSRPFENEFHCGSALHSIWGNSQYVTIENCIITNNACYYSTVSEATLINCILDNNTAPYGASATLKSYHHGCLIKSGNAASSYGFWNCTFGTNSSMNCTADHYVCNNSLIMGTVNWHNNSMAFTNCVFLSGKEKYQRVDCLITNSAAIAVDADYRPAIGMSVLIDAANEEYSDLNQFGGKDAYGGQRVYNGVIDVGAVEADWRAKYAADISNRGELTVTNASPEVVESETGTVCVYPGASVAGGFVPNGQTRLGEITAKVVGMGTLTVKVDGVVVGTVTGPAGVTPVGFQMSGKSGALEFLYAGEDGYAELLTIISKHSFLILLR